MIIILGKKKYVNIFKVRCYVYMCTFICMAKHGQISYDLSGIPYFLLEGAKPLQWCCHFEDAFVAKGLYFVCPHQS